MKLRLKKWEIEDATALMDVVNNIHVWKTLTSTTEFPLSKDQTIDYIKLCNDENEHIDAFAIELDGRVIGGVSLEGLKPPYHITYELNFWLAQEHWGKGIMTEVLYDIIQHGFMHLPAMKLTAKVFARDIRSINLLEKMGFKSVATFHSIALKCGEIQDIIMFEKTEIGN